MSPIGAQRPPVEPDKAISPLAANFVSCLLPLASRFSLLASRFSLFVSSLPSLVSRLLVWRLLVSILVSLLLKFSPLDFQAATITEALAVVGSIVAFVDFGAKLTRGTLKIHREGDAKENQSLNTVVTQVKQLSHGLLPDSASTLNSSSSICILAAECHKISEDLIELLQKIKAKDRNSKRQSLQASLSNIFHDGDKRDLKARIDSCCQKLHIELTEHRRFVRMSF